MLTTGQGVQPINPEDLILRFCQRLEFENETMKVAKDAVRLVQRMKRDWMTPGRRPAGVCGAALILAARMNNFRRTVREMSYVVKVQEQTILHRLEEFKATESSGLTVDEFRTIDIEHEEDPPIWTQQQEEAKNGKKTRRRKRTHMEFDDDGDNDQPTVISSRESSAVPPNSVGGWDTPAPTQRKRARLDSESMPPPPLPTNSSTAEDQGRNTESRTPSASPTATEGTIQSQTETVQSKPSTKRTSASVDASTPEPPTKRRKGRPAKAPQTPPLTQVTEDPDAAAQITVGLTDPTNMHHANALQSALASVSDSEDPSASPSAKSRPPVPDTEDISDSEFADDYEVNNCLLTTEEVAVKTRIWTHDNRDYLREKHAKELKEQLAEQNGTARQINRRKRKRTRMGDMSAYLPEGAEEGTPVAGSPEEAVMKMLGRRAYSKRINYDFLKGLLGSNSNSSGEGSRRGSSDARDPGDAVEENTRKEAAATGKNAQEAASEAADEEPEEEPDDFESAAAAHFDDGGIGGDESDYGDPDDPYEGGGFESD